MSKEYNEVWELCAWCIYYFVHTPLTNNLTIVSSSLDVAETLQVMLHFVEDVQIEHLHWCVCVHY